MATVGEDADNTGIIVVDTADNDDEQADTGWKKRDIGFLANVVGMVAAAV